MKINILKYGKLHHGQNIYEIFPVQINIGKITGENARVQVDIRMLLQKFFHRISPQVFPFPFDANSEFVSTFNKSDVLLELTQFHRLFFHSIYFWTARP